MLVIYVSLAKMLYCAALYESEEIWKNVQLFTPLPSWLLDPQITFHLDDSWIIIHVIPSYGLVSSAIIVLYCISIFSLCAFSFLVRVMAYHVAERCDSTIILFSLKSIYLFGEVVIPSNALTCFHNKASPLIVQTQRDFPAISLTLYFGITSNFFPFSEISEITGRPP